LKSLFSIRGLGGRIHRQTQGLDRSNALGHRPGQPKGQVNRLLPMFGCVLNAADHGLIVDGARRFAKTFEHGGWPLVEAVRFELTVELPPRQFSRLQP
jgi:hypothetical protein